MLSVSDAIGILLKHAERRVSGETCSLLAAAGRALAADVIAPIDVPPADNSAMDGYALRHTDWRGPDVPLELSQRVTAGLVPTEHSAGTAARIFTGAEVPVGADTVVMQEHCEGGDGAVRVLKLPEQGANIRRCGQDLATGQTVLTAGRRLRPQDLGLAASLGFGELDVYRRLRVAVMSTGDELCEPGQAIEPGQIYNSNRYLMKSQLETWGFEVIDLGVAKDDPGAVRAMLLAAAEQADVVVSSGGVSVGEEDHVKTVVAELGAIDLWRIAVKPGKPFAFGHVNGTPFIGLPGNPVSVFVTLLVIARPYLFACQGFADTSVRPSGGTALFGKKQTWREDYLRVRSGPDGLELFENQSSGVLYSTSWGDGLVRQAAGSEICHGDHVDYLSWEDFS